jgi:hypothetical protein
MKNNTSSCDFNNTLFKSFKSNKSTIKPELTDDWILKGLWSDGTITIESKKLNHTIHDISSEVFFKYISSNKISIDENMVINSTFIIGTDRNIYTIEQYTKWKNKFDSKNSTIINQKDYKIGYKYKTTCGSIVVYLGYRFVSNVITSTKKDEIKTYNKFSKIKKVHYYTYFDRSEYTALEKKSTLKFNEELGIFNFFEEDISENKKILEKTIKNNPVFKTMFKLYISNINELNIDNLSNENFIELLVQKVYFENARISCFEKEKPKKEIYELIEIDKNSHKYQLLSSSMVRRIPALFLKDEYDNFQMQNNGFNIDFIEIQGYEKYDGYKIQSNMLVDSQTLTNGLWIQNAYYIEDKTFIKNEISRGNINQDRIRFHNYIKVLSFYRCGIKKDI